MPALRHQSRRQMLKPRGLPVRVRCDLITRSRNSSPRATKLEATVAHRKSSLRSFLQRPHRITCPMHPSEVQAIARARISWANVNSIFSLPICDGGQVRLLTRCVLSLTSSHAPHPSASTATKYCTFPCACPPTLHAHGIRPARHRWPSAFAQHSALTTFRYLSRFLTGLNVSFTTRCGTQFGTQVSLLKMTQNDRNLIFSSAARAKNNACSKVNFAAVQRTPTRGLRGEASTLYPLECGRA